MISVKNYSMNTNDLTIYIRKIMLIVLCFSVKDSGSERVWEGVVGQLKETMKIFNQLLGHCNSSAYLISFPESNSHQNLFQTADFLPSD